MKRLETRKERQASKLDVATVYPFEVCTINFQIEDNVAFVVRSAACFGCSTVNVIGSVPDHKTLMAKSGTADHLVRINRFQNINQFLGYIRNNDIELISAELDSEAVSIHDYEFPINKRFCIVLGHEVAGVPVEILMNSKKVYIPMPGKGFCLNTSQAGTIFLHEAAKAYAKQKEINA